MLTLRGIDFGNAIGASGVQGFFSSAEYYHYRWYKYLPGYSFKGMTFCAKTMTLFPKAGNAKLCRGDQISFADKLPDCIKPYPLSGIALNAVGLSNPGAQVLLEKGIWQRWRAPFMLSFMSVETTAEKRSQELEMFVELLLKHINNFQSPFALQINYSCPNTGHDQEELLKEIIPQLEIASILNIPLIPKLNILVKPSVVQSIAESKYCDAICVSNTIPYGMLADQIHWYHLFGSAEKEKSPLAQYGGGGLSGSILFPLLYKWLQRAKAIDISKPIIAGGGIMRQQDVLALGDFDIVKAISPGSVAILRPWRVQGIIQTANKLFSQT